MMGKPKIRFKGYNEDWEQRKLNEVAEFNPKSDLPESFEYVDLESVVGTEMVSHRTETKETAPSRAQRLAQTGDVFFQTVRPYQRNNYLFTKPDNNYVFSTGYAHMRPKIDAEFLMCFLQTDSFVKVVLDNCTGTSYPAINSNDLSNLEIYLPTSEDEQRRIGCFITNLDYLITLHQHKCDEMKKMKKCMLQKMFPQNGKKVPEIRFEGFTNDWEQRKLNEIADRVSEKNKNNEFSEPFTNSAEQGIISQRDYFDREIVNNENLNGYYIVRNDDFIYNPRISVTAPVGPINRNRLGRNGVMSPLYTVFRTHDINNLYLEFYFKTTKWHRFMKLNGDSGARFDRFTISSTQFMEMPIPYPMLDEQIKIGEYFDTLDHLITLHQHKCDELQNLKKYMLQNMFV